MVFGVAVVAGAGDEDDAGVGVGVDGLAEVRGAVEGAEVIHAPAAVDNQAFADFLSIVFHPCHLVEPRSLVEVEGAHDVVGFWGLADGVAVGGAEAAADAGDMGAVGAVAIEAGGVAFGVEDFLVGLVFSAVVEAVGSGTREFEVVPSAFDAGVGSAVEVRMGIVEAPVGDADKHPFAVEGHGETEAVVDAVGAGVDADPIEHGGHLMGDAKGFDASIFLQQVEFVEGNAHSNDGGDTRSDIDTLIFKVFGIETRGYLGGDADADAIVVIAERIAFEELFRHFVDAFGVVERLHKGACFDSSLVLG